MKDRRRWPFVLGVVIAALHASFSLRGQDAKSQSAGRIPRLGFLGYGADPRMIDVFRTAMRDLGRVEGRDFSTEYRTLEGRVHDLPGRATDLVRLKVDVILAIGPASVRAAQEATGTIPIVMVAIGLDPVLLGIIPSLAHPGGNVTGVAAIGTELWAKRIQLLREAVPKLSRVAFLSNPDNPGNVLSAKEFGMAAEAGGLKVRFVAVQGPEQLQRALAEIAQNSPDAFACTRDVLLLNHAREIGDFALRNRLPTITTLKPFVEAGALMSYGADDAAQWRLAARYVDRILKGAKPGDLPVEFPLTYELAINRRTARALGLTIPPELIVLADRVIE